MEFDQFMKIQGCKTSPRHLFIGSGKKASSSTSGPTVATSADGEELLETVRTDFYQTPSAVTASFFLKKIDGARATVEFRAQTVAVDLPTTDPQPKRYKADVPLFGRVDPDKCSYKILGTKLEVTLHKADGESWPVLRSDDRVTGERIQVGRAGRV